MNKPNSILALPKARDTKDASDGKDLASPRDPSAHFANSASAALITFTNEIAVGSDGWAQLAPFGDYPGKALLRQADGTLLKFDAIQRLDRAAADGMVAKFKSFPHRLKRYFTGCPIYVGHPDVPAFANDYPDKQPKGMIVDLAVREDGLFCKPVFTPEGSELVETRQLRAFSGYWSAVEIPTEDGGLKMEDGNRATATLNPQSSILKLYRPDTLKSAGLTNNPNLPVHLLNEAPPNSTNAPPSSPKSQSTSGYSSPPLHSIEPQSMKKSLLIPILALHGLTLAETASDEEFSNALNQVSDRAKSAVLLANEKQGAESRCQAVTTSLAAKDADLAAARTERDQIRAAFVNERQARIGGIVEGALAAGKITAAERPDWERRLQNEPEFANESAALARLPPKIKTVQITERSGDRKIELANVSQRTDTIRDLVNTEMQQNGGHYDAAFAAVRAKNPALFAAMTNPQILS